MITKYYPISPAAIKIPDAPPGLVVKGRRYYTLSDMHVYRNRTLVYHLYNHKIISREYWGKNCMVVYDCTQGTKYGDLIPVVRLR